MKKILPISLGCVKNQIDLEYLLGKLTKKGFVLTDDFQECDYILLNTCSFINDARRETEEMIEKFKSTGKLIVTGCYPQRVGEKFFEEFGAVKWVLGTEPQKHSAVLATSLKQGKEIHIVNDNPGKYHECRNRLAFDSFHTYIKLSEGCSRRCAFCAIPSIRGKIRSRKKNNIFSEINVLSKSGYKEFNLVSEDTSLYGRDIYSKYFLNDLIKDLSEKESDLLFRLLYVFPDKSVYSVIDSIKSSDKFIKYIDIPFQHVSNKILKNMGRAQENPIKVAEYAKAESLLLRSSVMVGFPGETERDFKMLADFIEKGYIDKLGIFIYSDEEETPAFEIKSKLPEKIKIERFNAIIKIYKKTAKKGMLANVGRVKDAVFTRRENNYFVGRLIEDAPIIDSSLISLNRKIKLNTIMKIKILGVKNYTYFA